MSQRQDCQKFCSVCGGPRLHTRTIPTVNHILHLILTVLFLPWAAVWLIIAIAHGSKTFQHIPFRCNQCGSIPGAVFPEQALPPQTLP